jgi:hypothetical protein
MSNQDNTPVVVESFTIEQINKAIETMARCQSGAVTSIAKVMVMAVYASIVNQDAGVANALLKNLRKGMKKTAIVGVLESQGNLGYVSGTFAYFDAGKTWTPDTIAVIKAKCNAWESFKAVSDEDKSIDAAEEFAKFVEKLTKADAKVQLRHADLLPRIALLSAQISGELVLEVGTSD